MRAPTLSVVAGGLIVLLAAFEVSADELGDRCRQVLAQHQDAVVTVRLVLKQVVSFGGRDAPGTESTVEVTGTVLDESGLTVISLSSTDPAGTFTKLFSAGGGSTDEARMKVDSRLADVVILLPGGRELPAGVVLRDTDLDLAFVRPTRKPAKPLPFVPLEAPATARPMDEVVLVSRLGKVASRVPAVSASRIAARVDKPRPFYVLDESTGSGLGVPVFNLDGDLLGILVLRTIEQQSGMGLESLLAGSGHLGLLPIVVLAEDIQSAVDQVPPFAAEESSAEGVKNLEEPTHDQEAEAAETAL